MSHGRRDAGQTRGGCCVLARRRRSRPRQLSGASFVRPVGGGRTTTTVPSHTRPNTTPLGVSPTCGFRGLHWGPHSGADGGTHWWLGLQPCSEGGVVTGGVVPGHRPWREAELDSSPCPTTPEQDRPAPDPPCRDPRSCSSCCSVDTPRLLRSRVCFAGAAEALPPRPPGPLGQECLLWGIWMDVGRWRASRHFPAVRHPVPRLPSAGVTHHL